MQTITDDSFSKTPIWGVKKILGFGSETVEDPRSEDHIKRAEAYNLVWQYYIGQHEKPLEVKENQPDHNVIENWVRSIVDDGISFLFGKDVTFAADDDDRETPGEAAVNAVWADNALTGFNKGVFLTELAQNGGMSGTPYIRLHINDDESITLKNVNPALVDILTDPDDIEKHMGYDVVWKSGKIWKRHRIQPTESETWETLEGFWTGKEWMTTRVFPWDYNFPPMFHAKNLPLANSAYGLSDLGGLNPNDVINRISSDMNKILFYHAHPQMIARGLDLNNLQKIEGGAGTIFGTINTEASLDLLEMQSELSPSREYRKDIIQSLHETNGTVRNDPENARQGALSGFALKLLFYKLINTTEKKRRSYGGLLNQVNYAIQRLKGIEDPEPVTVRWQDPLPENRKEKAEITAIYTNAGASIRSAAISAGHSKEEAEMLAEVDLGMVER